MEKFNLTQTGQEVQEILDGAAKLSDVNTEKERAELAEEALGASIQQNAEDIDAIEAKIPSDATDENPLTDKEYVDGLVSDEATAREQADETLQGNIDAEETRAKAAEKQNADDIDAIEEKIPNQASSSNQLADKEYVEDLVSTASATFRGTFNLVSDLHLTVDASRSDIAAALGNAIATADNNDFAFVMISTSVETPNEIASIEKYKFNGTVWGFEYVLNNSGFTAAQWAAINSGITSALVTKLGALPTASELETALLAKQDVLTFDSAPTPGSLNPVTSAGIHTAIDTEKGARQNADAAIQQAIEAILVLIPSAASALNQLADKAFVNSSIATNTATFRGTFNLVSDLHLALNASHTDVANALENAISSANNNDYCFVQIPTSVDTPTEIRVTERYKFNGTAWAYEYDLNNSGFTVAQWEAINSAITSALVTKLSALPTAAELAASLDGKQAVLTFDNQPTSGSSNPVKSGGVYDVVAAINAKIPSDADPANKLVTEARIATIIGALDADFDLTSADEHITFKMTQRDGQITSVQILTYDIASALALTTLGGRVSINEGDISNLRAAYAALTQSDIVIVNGALPSSGQQQNIIYRQPDPDHTPPQFYSDYMWNGTTWVLMGQYNNAIDPRPKKGSQNLVTSGGVFDIMGALDVSELNATDNPHTLATYADLSAALAAIPSDCQKGGMSIKFVQNSDNKYVQYRLMSDTFNTTPADWQGVDDSPTAGSDNLPKSGGVVVFINNKVLKIEKQIEEIYHSHDADDDSITIVPNDSILPAIKIKKEQTNFNQDVYIKGNKLPDFALPFIKGKRSTEDSILLATDDGTICSEIQVGKKLIGDNVEETIDSVSFGDENNPSMVITDDYVRINNLRVENTQMWIGRIWATVGDSLVEYNYRSSKFVQQYIQEKRGITINNVGHSGLGFVNNEYIWEINNIGLNPGPDVITIQSSGNDMKFLRDQGLPLGNITDVGNISYCGYINSTLNRCFELFPTVPLGCITSPPWRTGYPGGEDKLFENMCNTFLEICYNHGIPTLDLFHKSNLHPENVHYRALVYSKDAKCEITTSDTPGAILVTAENIDDLQILSDDTLQIGDYVTSAGGVHPNELGHYLMAPRVDAFLQTLIL